MKKYLLILTLLLGSFSLAFAQENQPGDEQARQERIKALYVAYVTQQLQLTPDEAQKFWPVHTQFENELKAVNKDLPELPKEQARLDIKKKYQDNFVKILGNGRCERFFKMNDEFKRKLRDRLQNQRNNPQRPKMRRGQ
jgi:Skp family chaperone for outer membrane proteins